MVDAHINNFSMKIYSAAIDGLSLCLTEIEADISRGFPAFTIVGCLVRAVVDGDNLSPLLVNPFSHEPVQVRKPLLGLNPLGDACLVGDDDDAESRLFQVSKSLECTGRPFPFLSGRGVVPAFDIDDSVAVEEDILLVCIPKR